MRKSSLIVLLLLFFSFSIFPVQAAEESTYFHIINFDHPLSFKEIKDRYSCYDKIDGDITHRIKYYSEYETDYIKGSLRVKDYPLEISISNSRGYTTTRIDIISVRDFAAPTLEVLKQEIDIDISTQDIEKELLTCFAIKDNYDVSLRLEWTGLEALEQPEEKEYSVSLIVYDSSENASSLKTILVHVKKSIFTHICKQSITIKGSQKSKTDIINEWKNIMQFPTDYESISIESNYFTSSNKKGIYQAEITLTYEDGIKHIYQFKIINEVSKENKSTPLIVYISLSCIGIIALLGILIYRKRR